MTYFCGDSVECRTLGSEAALETAKRNIVSHYVTVGLLEMLDTSLLVLQCTLPRYFSGLSRLHGVTALHQRNSMPTENKVMTEEARLAMRKVLENEYKLYEFIKKRLLTQYETCVHSL